MDIQQLKAAGFSDEEIQNYNTGKSNSDIPAFDVTADQLDVQKLINAGFGEREIAEYASKIQSSKPVNPINPQPAEQPASSGGLINQLAQRGQNIYEAVTTPTDVPWRPALRTAGELAGSVSDIAGKAIEKGYTMLVPETVRQEQKRYIGEILKTPVGQFGLDALHKGQEYYEHFKKIYPDVAKDLEAVVNISAFIPIEKGAQVVAPAVGEVAGKAAGVLERSVAKQIQQDTLDIVSRDLGAMTKTQRQTAIRMGQVEKPGIFKNAVIKTTPQDLEIARSVEGLVSKSNNPIQNIDNIKTKISELAQQTERLPAENNMNFNNEQIRSVLEQAKIESSDVVAMEMGGEKKYDTMVNVFMKILKDKPKELSSVLDARKEFDREIKKKFGNTFERDTIMSRAVKDVRMAANDFVADSLPEGNNFKNLLKQQSNMYRAIDRITLKASPTLDEGTMNRITSVIKKHPWLSLEAAGALGGMGVAAHLGAGGAITSILTNPIALGSLATYGTYRVGKTIVTSQALKTSLAKLLRSTENLLSLEDRVAIQSIMNNLPQGGSR